MRSSAEPMLLALALGAGALPVASAAGQPSAPGVAYAPPAAPIADEQPPAMPPPRYDAVGYASWSDAPGPITAAHRSLPPGSFAEVTSLDTGKTILVAITGIASSARELELSGAAALALGLNQGMAGGVRVRAVNPNEADVAALQAGQAAVARPDAPPVLLNPLRRKLATMPSPRATPRSKAQAVPVPRPAQPRTASPGSTTTPGYYVQVAALSDLIKARGLARSLGGSVVSSGGLHRIRIGPYADARQAQQARDAIARRGYGDARIVRPD